MWRKNLPQLSRYPRILGLMWFLALKERYRESQIYLFIITILVQRRDIVEEKHYLPVSRIPKLSLSATIF